MSWAAYNLEASFVSGYDGVEVPVLELTDENSQTYKEAKIRLSIDINSELAPFVVQYAAGDLNAFLNLVAVTTSTHGALNLMLSKTYLYIVYNAHSKREGDRWDKKAKECKSEIAKSIKGFAKVLPSVLGISETTTNQPKAYAAVIGGRYTVG